MIGYQQHYLRWEVKNTTKNQKALLTLGALIAVDQLLGGAIRRQARSAGVNGVQLAALTACIALAVSKA
ncbi:hypothetical protein [Kitasatospora sp. NBC_01302]|uniref:hypothetical protein n=1 Tax=Kitasatospora sp. NBC_01302 TaxID=2903575 RepID=UPI002E135323|nr:hypothetical protein OG294_40205 [Kitasatospora sp. NBC_01302]